jgi:O-antigen ligase
MKTLVGLDPARMSLVADALAVAVVVSLPWSTSATTILVILWALSLLPAMVSALDLPSLGRALRSPAGALPVALLVLGAIGMAWAQVSWPERWGGFDSFPKLLAIPLLMAQFQRSPRGHWMLIGFLASASVLLALSWFAYVTQWLPWRIKDVAVPVKDRITQGTILTLCLFGLMEYAVAAWKRGQSLQTWWGGALAVLFFLNIVFATVSRTALVTVPILLVLFGARHLRGRQMIAFLVGLAALAALLWVSSPYLRERVTNIPDEITNFSPHNRDTSAGSRIAFWKQSVEIMREAPLLGQGTGAITAAFARVAGTASSATNPHNQILTVGVQLGLVGIAVLIAMWAAHVRLFLAAGLVSWIGLVVVVENIVASLFNSQLFDFTTGWIYVLGVGVAGGMVMKGRTI